MFRTRHSQYWPVELHEQHAGHTIALRALGRRDIPEWLELRARNRTWTGPWDSTNPRPEPLMTTRQAIDFQNAEAHAGRLLPWAVTVDSRLAGQVHVFSIVRGAQQGGTIGYWVDQAWAGLGITPVAVALASEYCFQVAGLHRLEINVRPENANSLRVVEKLGFRDEGLRRSFLHIDGAWRDHRTFALTAEESAALQLRARVVHN